MKIVMLGGTNHAEIINKMLTEDLVSDPSMANVSLKALGLKIKSVVVERGETVVYVDNSDNLLLG